MSERRNGRRMEEWAYQSAPRGQGRRPLAPEERADRLIDVAPATPCSSI
jgi:hypothetical protein